MNHDPSGTLSKSPDFSFDPASLARRLEAARREIETKFTLAGGVLAEAVQGIATLTAALEEISQGLSPATTAATTQQLKDAAAQLEALPAKQAARRGCIAVLAEQQALLAVWIDDMRQTLAYMRAFTVSIKITAGGISKADSEFEIFAQEIHARVSAGRTEVDALAESLRQLEPALAGAALQAATLDRSCADMIPAVPNELLASAAVMAAHRGKVALAMENAGMLARDIRQKVGRMLGALQIGDITRQRVEHVQTGLALLQDIDPALSATDAANIRAAMCALLTAQCESIVENFNREVAALDAGLSGLAGDAKSLLGLRELAYGQGEGVKGGFLHALEQKISAAVKLVAEIEKAENLAQDTGRQAAVAARDLSARLDEVQRMKTDVLYMALNTTLKASRMGDEGRPLATIAAELRTHAGYLEVIANHCVASLKMLFETADEMVAGPAETAEMGAGATLLAAVEQIDTASGKTENNVVNLAIQGEAVLQLLTRSAASFDFQSDIGDRLKQAAQDLADQAMGAKPCTAVTSPLVDGMFSRLADVYTMAQERDIHTGIAGMLGLSIAPPPVHTAAEDDLEDALF